MGTRLFILFVLSTSLLSTSLARPLLAQSEAKVEELLPLPESREPPKEPLPIAQSNMRTQEVKLGTYSASDKPIEAVVSSDGRHMAVLVKRGDKQFVIVDGKEDAPYDRIDKGSVVFSPNGKHAAYVARKQRREMACGSGWP